MRSTLRDIDVWTSAGGCIASLLGAALLLWLALPAVAPDWRASGATAATVELPGSAFSAAAAASARSEEAILVATRRVDGEALLNAAVRLEAAALPILQLDLTGVTAKSRLMLAWRTAEAPDETRFVELPRPVSGTVWYSLLQEPEWQGTVTQIALRVFGESTATPLRLTSLRLQGRQADTWRKFVWWQWTASEPWSSSYLNWYTGSVGTALAHPAAVTSAWAGLSLVFLWVWSRALCLPRRLVIVAGLAAVFIPWLVLDRLWQHHLDAQVQASKLRFAGHTQADKHYREDDAVIQRYAAHILRVLPPKRGERLILLHQGTGHNYERLRLQFHLLPHNIYNYGSDLPPPESLRTGDHVLLFGPLPEIEFDATSGTLRDERHEVGAKLIDAHRYGLLYRLETPAPRQGR